jgi:hypothetical protein
MIEELLHGGPKTAALPDAAKAAMKGGKTLDQYRSVGGTSEGTAYKSSRGV